MNKISPSVCFIGSTGRFSHSALETLCALPVCIERIILAGHAPAATPKAALPVAVAGDTQQGRNALLRLSQHHHIPLCFLGAPSQHQAFWQHLCAETPPDYLFVACFPQKLPSTVLSWPRQHSINLHPSLLPRYRGPDPIYWQRRQGETRTGVSLHLLTDAWDAGPLVHQHSVAFPAQASRAELDTLLAREGALAFGRCLSRGIFHPTPQDERLASYQPLPGLAERRTP